VPRHLVLPALLLAALVMGVIASSPWIGISLLGLVYLSLIPFSWLAYRKQALQDRRTAAGGGVVPLRSIDGGAQDL
jgi:CDP-diacylglycerol---serine O-phosphatidyltransferase